MITENSDKVPITVKSDAYDQLCKAYMDAQQMDFSLFGKRSSGFNSPAEYVGYAFIQMAFRQGAITSPKQESLQL